MALDIIVLTNAAEIHPSWSKILAAFPGAKNISMASPNVLKQILNAVNTAQFWMVLPNIDIENFDFEFECDSFEKKIFNVFHPENTDSVFSVALLNRGAFMRGVSQHKIQNVYDVLSCEVKHQEKLIGQYFNAIVNFEPDIILISFFDDITEKLKKLRIKYGNRIKHVENVKGIYNAHYAASKASDTSLFYVIDADAEVDESFEFNFEKSNIVHSNSVYVWQSRNPLNNLIYGYGGIKLMHRSMFSSINNSAIDVTTSIANGTIVVDEIGSTSRFNTDPLSTWRSAFRECAKLSSSVINGSIIKENEDRLNCWTTFAEGDYSLYCLHGAKLGKKFGEENRNNKETLSQINDFEWLESEFRSYFGS